MFSAMQLVLNSNMPRAGLSDYAIEQLARDRVETDKSAVQSLSWGTFLENEFYYRPMPVVGDTTRRKRKPNGSRL